MKLNLITILVLCSVLVLNIECYHTNKNSNKNLIREELFLHSNEDFAVVNLHKKQHAFYTQGIFFSDDNKYLYESGGLYKQSSISKINANTFEIIKTVNLTDNYFAEGIAKCGDSIYQLTWKERDILKYDTNSLNLTGTIRMDDQIREGWGLTSLEGDINSIDTSNTLIATDGTSNIYFLDCKDNLKVFKIVEVTDQNGGIDRLNALAFAKGYLYANRYFDTRIFKIDVLTGQVVYVYNLKNLQDFEIKSNTLSTMKVNSGDVLNGIAYNKVNDSFILTGKLWGFYFEVKLN